MEVIEEAKEKRTLVYTRVFLAVVPVRVLNHNVNVASDGFLVFHGKFSSLQVL